LRILQQAETDLLEVALAAGAAGVFASPGKHWEEDGRQNRYNSDNDEQFDQGKSPGCGAAGATADYGGAGKVRGHWLTPFIRTNEYYKANREKLRPAA
jgi:hypothetical protein